MIKQCKKCFMFFLVTALLFSKSLYYVKETSVLLFLGKLWIILKWPYWNPHTYSSSLYVPIEASHKDSISLILQKKIKWICPMVGPWCSLKLLSERPINQSIPTMCQTGINEDTW